MWRRFLSNRPTIHIIDDISHEIDLALIIHIILKGARKIAIDARHIVQLYLQILDNLEP